MFYIFSILIYINMLTYNIFLSTKQNEIISEIWQNITQDVKGTREEYNRGICRKYVKWNCKWNSKNPCRPCKGKWIHAVCNFGVGDLDRIQASSCLFANKFNLDVDKNAAVNHFLHVLNLTLNETNTVRYQFSFE